MKLVCVLALLASVSSYRHGDPLQISKRTQHQAARTGWHDINIHTAPHFGVDRTVEIELAQEKAIASDAEFKIAFSVSDSSFLTQWAVLSDGRGRFVSSLEFKFRTAGSQVLSMKMTPSYEFAGDEMPMNLKGTRPTVLVHFAWDDVAPLDTATGFNVLLGMLLVGSATAGAFVLAGPMNNSSSKGGGGAQANHGLTHSQLGLPTAQAGPPPAAAGPPPAAAGHTPHGAAQWSQDVAPVGAAGTSDAFAPGGRAAFHETQRATDAALGFEGQMASASPSFGEDDIYEFASGSAVSAYGQTPEATPTDKSN